MSTPSTGFQLFARERRVRLTTYEREGTPFGHGAQIAVEGDRAYVRTHARARQREHIERYPEVELAAATLTGTPAGAPMKARVRELRDSEARHAAAQLARRHPLTQGFLVPLGYRLMFDRPVHYELRLVGE
ncbi:MULTISPECIES: hypothetical protein [Streptomyces]|uniref:Pyridoxamine 5'-phosphate oxidase putative domain-containing protein n=1 Tax=Streptomyces qinglanensis TaxID=943816 RepID=A0A1E7K012_9ACTN|nr:MULTISPECIES: hypothetical protein [Streptomyces]OEU97261.1 hypothetical protein AN217_04530 [Streptomyces qinglanensis]OEV22851.1 hypothetical protein AN220_27530 [Streptomyces nanshensis]